MIRSIDDPQDLTTIQHTLLVLLEERQDFTDTFYFTGETLLKALGIVPRESNDLDFFTFPGTDERTYLQCLLGIKEFLHARFGSENGVVETDRGILRAR